MKPYKLFIIVTATLAMAWGCRGPKVTRTDTESSGYALIGVDETLSPVIGQQLAVFNGLNPEAEIEPVFVSDRELFSLLMADSVRLVVATRELTLRQLDSLKDRKMKPRTQRLACDGIALIVNRANPDSMIGVPALRDVMAGKITRWEELSGRGHSPLGEIQVVFDHPNSSTLRFIADSVMRGENLSGSLRALETNAAVVDYVAANPGALGVVGVNWIKNPGDSTQLGFDPRITVMAVGTEKEVTEDNTFKPYPAFLNNGSYPLRRDVFIIITDSYGTLPSGFVKFAAGDAGQRIILKAGLVPGTRPTREVMMEESF